MPAICYLNLYFDISRNIVEIIRRVCHILGMELDQTAACLEALGNPTRLDIYRMLVRAGQQGLPVGAIQERTAIPRSTLSHHLHRLISVGLVAQERQGTTLLCRANYATMNDVVIFLTAECCADLSESEKDCWPAA